MIRSKLTTKEEWFDGFRTTPTCKSILEFAQNYYDDFYSTTRNRQLSLLLGGERIAGPEPFSMTPREEDMILKSFSLDAIRIVDYMSSQGKLPIYDIGCGMNLFSNFYDVVGMDIKSPDTTTPLIHFIQTRPFDKVFVEQYREAFPSAIAINSLHFISLNEAADRVNDFISTIKPKGYGYITFNTQRMIDHTDAATMLANNFLEKSTIKSYFDKIVEQLVVDVIEYENKLETHTYDHMDGSVRILFVKQ